ncbi:MAG: hypothetical protein J6W11_05300 [Alphaproteobacteria bacterium]|nr:hypothetical protein [Alphaproteobacteria bacterium]
MQKNNIKSFVCSFLFSILAVYGVQKVFLRAPSTQHKVEPDVSSNNIMPQKISLFADNISAAHHKEPALMLASSTPPVDVAEISKLAPAPAEPVIQEEAVEQSVAPIKSQEVARDISHSLTDLANAEEITLSDSDKRELAESKALEERGIVYADISDTLQNTSFDAAEEIPLAQESLSMHGPVNVQTAASASQIAMVDPGALINSIQEPDILSEEKTLAEADIKQSELGDMMSVSENASEIDESAWAVATAATEDTDIEQAFSDSLPANANEDSPWVLARGNKYAKNQAVVEEFSHISEEALLSNKSKENEEPVQDTSSAPNVVEDFGEQSAVHQTFNEPLLKQKDHENGKLAYQMIQNILIPIPDDILNDADLTPDLTAAPDNKDEKTTVRVNNSVSRGKPELNDSEKQSGLFKSITSWFGKNKSDDNAKKSSKDKETSGTFANIKDKVYSALGSIDDYKKAGREQIMPAELRLSFQPNRAEISGQTLRWIYAFADNARDDPDVFIEVRIDGTSSFALQQKRLNLLSSIFASRGVDYRKINTVFTSREPNSFIIRNIRFNDNKGDTDK